MANRFNFQDQLIFSDGTLANAGIQAILLNRIPGTLDVIRAEEHNDRQGTDYWIRRRGLPALSVDAKTRKDDPISKYGKDDLALETWSVVEKNIVGWTRNPRKRSDYILWFFKPTGRFFLVSFPALCWVFSRRWQAWKKEFKCRPQITEDRNGRTLYHSECVFVPRELVCAEIAVWQSATAQKQ